MKFRLGKKLLFLKPTNIRKLNLKKLISLKVVCFSFSTYVFLLLPVDFRPGDPTGMEKHSTQVKVRCAVLSLNLFQICTLQKKNIFLHK